MSTLNVPVKTALGRQELSHRVHGVSQRHRTVLLLVDGQRPLSLVLSLAQQAGASTQYFEDLLRLGLVELPEPPAEPVAPEPEPANKPVLEPQAASPTVADPVAAATVEPPIEVPAAQPEAKKEPKQTRIRAMTPDAEVLVPSPSPPVELRVIEAPADITSGLPLAQQIRELLLDVVRIEPPPVRYRIPTRLAKATTLDELGEMVEVIEQCLRRAGHSLTAGVAAPRLRAARDLLGLGNTRIQENDGAP